MTPKKLTNALKTPPMTAPSTTPAASDPFESPALRTDAQASPSGNFNSEFGLTTNTRRIGIMNKTPNNPPVKAISVVSNRSNSSQAPIRSKAGMVKMIPAANDSPAEAAVCT